MSAQLLCRAHDPISSVLAAEGASAFSGPHCDRILQALATGPATPHELQAITGLTVVQIDRRLPELLRSGKARVVQFGGEDLVRGGARVWEAV
ncbi:MAG: hypothetical protein LBJ15_19525 [Comamonas sp.]|jgi:hypothetical protein|uniref:hypothetical protein n=1 Tax=Comamonas sp. TaxID=34028 RepID=UPI0028225A05|nr:hypothetical protein [Comamonas sp.]MDR0216166.1 hypothetical protein [Comamonas sp.]